MPIFATFCNFNVSSMSNVEISNVANFVNRCQCLQHSGFVSDEDKRRAEFYRARGIVKEQKEGKCRSSDWYERFLG